MIQQQENKKFSNLSYVDHVLYVLFIIIYFKKIIGSIDMGIGNVINGGIGVGQQFRKTISLKKKFVQVFILIKFKIYNKEFMFGHLLAPY